MFESKGLKGYDAAKNGLVFHGFGNDGVMSIMSTSVAGNSWTTKGSKKDRNGKEHQTRTVLKLSDDGRSCMEVFEYSSDGGKTWKKAWESKRVKVTR